MSLSLSLITIITSLSTGFSIFTIILLSPSSITILTKINKFST
jgi:hypothetical protein